MNAFAGATWSVRGVALPTGERLDADIRFTPLFGGAAMHERTTVRIADGDVRLGFVYETIFGAAVADGAMGMITVGSDGTVMEGRGRMIDGAFVGSTSRRTDGEPTGHRTLALAGDRLRWVIERGDGDDRVPLMDVQMRRDGGTLAIPAPPADAADAAGAAERLRPFIGTWTTRATWSSGESLVGRNVFRMGHASGYAVVDTFARDGGGPEYHRYRSMYVRDADRGWMAYSADFAGRLSGVPITLRDAESGLAIDTRNAMTTADGRSEIDQTSAIIGPDTFRWTVRMRSLPDGPWESLMDTMWTRGSDRPARSAAPDTPDTADTTDTAAAPTPRSGTTTGVTGDAARSIDGDLFDVRGEAGRSFAVSEVVPATPAACFDLWTTPEGVRAFMGIDSRIELAVGGPYEWYFVPDAPPGQRGGEGCQVLAWVPGELLAFTWNAPPAQPASRARRAWVVVRFEATDSAADGSPRTRVRLDHCGLGEALHWRETEAYFQRAWPSVLAAMRRHLEGEGEGVDAG
jgi:uncharacterized protein YndB with AHSA1/START domain